MLTKDVSQELEQIFQTLQAQGKTPTLAVVKARLSTSVPMPALITAIKSWKAGNNVPKVEVAASSAHNTDEQIQRLMEQVALLTQRVDELEKQLTSKKEK